MPSIRRPRTTAALFAVLASAGLLASQVLAAPPAADFTVSPGVPTVGESANFSATVTDLDAGDTHAFAWSFGDGGTSTSEDPPHTFQSAGDKTVTLMVTDAPGGESDTVTKTIRVNAPPTPAFGFLPANPNPNQPVTFTSTSSDAEGGVSHAWDLDNDGQFDDGSDPSETTSFATGGDKTVGLRVTDTDGAARQTTRTVSVFNNSPPAASFSIAGTNPVTPAVPDVNETINLASTSTDPNGNTTIVDWRWDLDNDGQFDDRTGATIQHSFGSPGTKTVGLEVTDSSGAKDEASQTVRINALPTAVINHLNSQAEAGQKRNVPLAGQAFAFTAGPVPQIPGSPPAQGCPAPAPSAASPGSTDPEDALSAYAWDLDNNGTYETAGQNVPSPGSGYLAGTRTVGLRVTDADGAQASTTLTFRVNSAPLARFLIEPLAPLINTETTFSSTSADADAADHPGALIYSWDLDGDNNFCEAGETGPSAKRSFPTANTNPGYRVRLRVTDTGGVTREVSRQVIVQNTVPTASFSFSPSAPLPGQATTFRGSASSASGKAIQRMEWDFDFDPSKDQFDVNATGAAVTRSFSSPGRKTVGLKVYEVGGGYTIVDRTIVVNAPPRAGFTVSPRSVFAGDTAVVASTSGDSDGPLVAQDWDFDNDGKFDDASGGVINARFSRAGSFLVRLRVTDDKGATAVAASTVTVRKRPLALLTGVVIRIRGSVDGRFTEVRRLLVQAPKGSTIVVKCRKHGCDERVTKRGTGRKLRVRALEGVMAAGTKIQIAVSKSGYLTQKTTYTTRRRKGPLRKDVCVEPGSRKGTSCPAGS